jgi:uncharacterized protein GlcG (DUF336 family)
MERRTPVRSRHPFFLITLTATFAVGCSSDNVTNPTAEASTSLAHLLPDHDVLRSKLQEIVGEQNGGLGFQMWATIIDRNGRVVDVVFSGEKRTDQWPASRAISAQKANTANGLSLDGFALSTANLYAAVQPGGSLFGLQESNPVDPKVAYAGKASDFGTRKDPMIGKRIGGINVFGGGLALYAPSGKLLGGLGLSGDTSCSDHIKAWKLRHALNLDNVPDGVAPSHTDNIIYQDATLDGFEHPTCLDLDGQGNSVDIANDLPTTHPVGPDE